MPKGKTQKKKKKKRKRKKERERIKTTSVVSVIPDLTVKDKAALGSFQFSLAPCDVIQRWSTIASFFFFFFFLGGGGGGGGMT